VVAVSYTLKHKNKKEQKKKKKRISFTHSPSKMLHGEEHVL
jgi:hypothetical protein